MFDQLERSSVGVDITRTHFFLWWKLERDVCLFFCSGSRFSLMKLLASLTGCLAAIIKDHAFGVQILQGDVESLEGLRDFSLGQQSADLF